MEFLKRWENYGMKIIHEIEIYCDGATSSNGSENQIGGYAVAVIMNEHIIWAEGFGPFKGKTNNQCELDAVLQACHLGKLLIDKIHAEGAQASKIRIYTDSAYVHNCYKQKWYENWKKNGWVNAKKEPVKNKYQWECLIPYFQDEDIEFLKVKGHSGDRWNSLVDELAVAARKGDPKRVCYEIDIEGGK